MYDLLLSYLLCLCQSLKLSGSKGHFHHNAHPPKIKLTTSAEKVTDRPSATQPTNLAWDVLHPDYIVAFTAFSSLLVQKITDRSSVTQPIKRMCCI